MSVELFDEKGRLQVRELALANGMDFPSDEELVMMILGSGTRQKPVDILSGEVMRVVLASDRTELVGRLMSISGMGRNRALAVAAAIELGRRANRGIGTVLEKPLDVVPFLQSYAIQSQEHFLCVSVNGAREIMSIRVVCVGSGNRAVLRIAEIFSEAVRERASGIIISHNHPGGNPEPSEADMKTTARVLQAGELLGIALLDHIIISRNGYFSFLENDMLHG